MAEQFINDIYKYAQLIPDIKQVIEYCRMDDRWMMEGKWTKVSESIASFCRYLVQQENAVGEELWNSVISVHTDMKDLLRFSDRLESETLPVLYKAASALGDIDVEEGSWRMFSSRSGFLSLERIDDNLLIHSANDPVWEARTEAKHLYRPKMQKFYILGCGLGYLARELYRLSDESLDIYIFEMRPELVTYALNYGVLGDIPEDRLHIISDVSEEYIFEKYHEDADLGERGYIGYYIYDWELKYFNENLRKELRDISTYACNYDRFCDKAQRNFLRNIFAIPYFINEKADCFNGDRWIVVAAGPSLTSSIDFIKEHQGQFRIAAITRVLSKLINAGITPDIGVVVDPQNEAYDVANDIESIRSIPLAVGIYACWKYAAFYPGEKYIAPVDGLVESNEYIRARGFESWEVAGTVTSLAIELACRMGAKEIHLIGLDLAYPGNKKHAEGTGNEELTDNRLIEVPSMNGGKVLTSADFKIYISEVEEQITCNPKVTFYNHSKDGAFIRGTKLYE